MSSFEEERERYRPRVPETYNPVIEIVERWASVQPPQSDTRGA